MDRLTKRSVPTQEVEQAPASPKTIPAAAHDVQHHASDHFVPPENVAASRIENQLKQLLAQRPKEVQSAMHDTASFFLRNGKELDGGQLKRLSQHAENLNGQRSTSSKVRDFFSFLPGISQSTETRTFGSLKSMIDALSQLPQEKQQAIVKAVLPFVDAHRLNANQMPFISRLVRKLTELKTGDPAAAMQEAQGGMRWVNPNYQEDAMPGFLATAFPNPQSIFFNKVSSAVKRLNKGQGMVDLAADEQSTHRTDVHLSIGRSVISLDKRYGQSRVDPQKIVGVARNMINDRLKRGDGNKTMLKNALTALKNIEGGYDVYRDGVSKKSIKEALALVWSGVHDANATAGSPLSERDIHDRETNLIRGLAEAATEYGPWSPACMGGTFNKVVETLDRIHDDVTIVRNFPGFLSDILQEEYQKADQLDGTPAEKKKALETGTWNRLHSLLGEQAISSDSMRRQYIEHNLEATAKLFDM